MARKIIPTGYTYAEMGGPPKDWNELVVVDRDANKLVHQIVSVNTEKGWVDRFTDEIPEGDIGGWPVERLEGNFEICRMVDIDETTYVERDET